MSQTVKLDSADGVMDARIFTPTDAPGALPAVLLFTDIGGLRPSYYDKAQAVADAGYAVLLPNVYYRDAAGEVVPTGASFRDPEVRKTLLQYAARLTPAAQARDFSALLDCVDSRPEFAADRVGVVGYCMTGSFALRMAALHPESVCAAAAFHPARLAAEDDATSIVHVLDTITAQVYLGYADQDEYMPAAQIARMDGALATAGVHFAAELYRGAAHGFTASDAPSYDAMADARHYRRLFALLHETIG